MMVDISVAQLLVVVAVKRGGVGCYVSSGGATEERERPDTAQRRS